MLYRALFVFILFVLSHFGMLAQDEAPFPIGDDWTYRSMCSQVDTNLSTDAGWDGTIIMRGHYGYHGYNADWETPRVMSFDRTPNGYVRSLSPDARWAVEAVGDTECSRDRVNSCSNVNFRARSLRIRAISSTNPHDSIDISNNYLSRSHHTGYDRPQPTWIDQYHIVYSSGPPYNVIDIRDGSVETREDLPLFMVQPSTLSPNHLYRTTRMRDDTNETSDPVIIDAKTDELVERVDIIDNLEWIPEASYGLWSPNSNFLLALKPIDEQRELYLYDRASGTLRKVLNAHRLSFSGFLANIIWSPNSNYLFINPSLASDGGGISATGYHVIDIEQRTISPMCWDHRRGGIAWSADGTQLAGILDEQLIILNLETMEWRIVTQPILGNYRVVGWQDN